MTAPTDTPVDAPVTTEHANGNGKKKRGRKIGGVPTTIDGVDAPALVPFTPNDTAGVRTVALNTIVWTELNPRKDFDPVALQELADSIRSEGHEGSGSVML